MRGPPCRRQAAEKGEEKRRHPRSVSRESTSSLSIRTSDFTAGSAVESRTWNLETRRRTSKLDVEPRNSTSNLETRRRTSKLDVEPRSSTSNLETRRRTSKFDVEPRNSTSNLET